MTPVRAFLSAALLISAVQAQAGSNGLRPVWPPTGSGTAFVPSGGGGGGSGFLGQFGVQVSGNHLINTFDGSVAQLRGVNVPDLEDTPFASDPWLGNDPSFTAMAGSWGINVARLTLSEGNWLVGSGGYPLCNPNNYYTAAQYQATVATAVSQAIAAGVYIILDLHRSAVPNLCSTAQPLMADTQYSLTFWTQVASIYANNPAVIFELVNEPVAPHTPGTTTDWMNYTNGQLQEPSDTNTQTMLNTIRSTGAGNVVIMDALDYGCCAANYILPHDSLATPQLVMAKHEYWATTYDASWNTAHANGVPILITEFGDNDGSLTNTNATFAWADPLGIGYIAWAWNYNPGWGGQGNYQLVTSQAGAIYPSTFANAVNAHFRCRKAGTC